MAMMINEDDVLEISGYLGTMDSRLMSLHKISQEIAAAIDVASDKVKIKRDEYNKMIDDIKKDISGMEEEVRNLQKAIVQVITILKASVKADEFERFKKRIDLWAPESFVTRRETYKELEKL
jgi:uncharacterized protein YicC (UPF0701 family)